MVTVKSVVPGSVAEKAGVRPEDVIISVNGNEIRDVLDYRFYITEKKLDLLIHRGADLLSISIVKPMYSDIGLEFESFLMDKKISCTNKCVFCFIDQNPKGMRETVYFKDDDSRLSFLMGNYVTLTNMTDGDIDRIIAMRMTPINVSVHTTNPELRCKMMNNRFAGRVLSYLERLTSAGIELNCQIVLCKGLNDGKELSRTVSDLEKYFPTVNSIAVVSAGLTDHRKGLYPLEPFDAKDCASVISQVNEFGDRFVSKYSRRILYCSDEFYLKAGREIPGAEYYEDYPQLENGVGMIRSFADEANMGVEDVVDILCEKKINRCVSVATGTASYPLICSLAKKTEALCPGLTVKVHKIINNFFGESITVSGLLTGKDISEQLSGLELGDELLIPENALRSGEEVFLCGMTLDELSEALKTSIRICENDGFDFIDAAFGIAEGS